MKLAVLLVMELYGLSSILIKQHFFVKEKMTWGSAYNYCKTYFHDLSTFTNENEQRVFLEDAAYQPSDAWVGLYTESGVCNMQHILTGIQLINNLKMVAVLFYTKAIRNCMTKIVMINTPSSV